MVSSFVVSQFFAWILSVIAVTITFLNVPHIDWLNYYFLTILFYSYFSLLTMVPAFIGSSLFNLFKTKAFAEKNRKECIYGFTASALLISYLLLYFSARYNLRDIIVESLEQSVFNVSPFLVGVVFALVLIVGMGFGLLVVFLKKRIKHLGALGFFLFLTLFVSTFFIFQINFVEKNDGVSASPQPIPKSPYKVLLIGLDGLSWNILNPLMEKGMMTNLKRMREGGVYGELKTLPVGLSPVIWSSIATGESPGQHKVFGFQTKKLPFTGFDLEQVWDKFPPYLGLHSWFGFLMKTGIIEEDIVTSQEREKPALWNILSAYKKNAAVLNWMVTWPPERINGTVVSDHFIASLFPDKGSLKETFFEFPTLNGSDFIYPETLNKSLSRKVRKNFEEVLAAKSGMIDFFLNEIDVLSYIYSEVSEKTAYDFTALYTHSTDTPNHFMNIDCYENLLKGKYEMESQCRLAVQIYQKADELLGKILAQIDEETIVLLVSDHGVTTGYVNDQKVVQHFTGPPGIFVAYGKDVKKGRIDSASIFDIAPTVLDILNTPISMTMPGKPLTKLLLKKDERRLKDTLFVPQYTFKKEKADAKESEAKEKLLKRFKALGYMQ